MKKRTIIRWIPALGILSIGAAGYLRGASPPLVGTPAPATTISLSVTGGMFISLPMGTLFTRFQDTEFVCTI